MFRLSVRGLRNTCICKLVYGRLLCGTENWNSLHLCLWECFAWATWTAIVMTNRQTDMMQICDFVMHIANCLVVIWYQNFCQWPSVIPVFIAVHKKEEAWKYLTILKPSTVTLLSVRIVLMYVPWSEFMWPNNVCIDKGSNFKLTIFGTHCSLVKQDKFNIVKIWNRKPMPHCNLFWNFTVHCQNIKSPYSLQNPAFTIRMWHACSNCILLGINPVMCTLLAVAWTSVLI
jgi:hypothetical protein